MRIRITEDQLDKIKEQESYKKMLFKYWDKFGSGITNTMLKLFGIDYRGWEIRDVHRLLTEYLGVNKAREIAMEFFHKKKHTIDDCGSYKFDFTIDNVEVDGTKFIVTLTVDDINGKVTLITDNNTYPLIDLLEDSNLWWEIESELQDCVHQYIEKNVEDKTGLSSIFIFKYVKR